MSWPPWLSAVQRAFPGLLQGCMRIEVPATQSWERPRRARPNPSPLAAPQGCWLGTGWWVPAVALSGSRARELKSTDAVCPLSTLVPVGQPPQQPLMSAGWQGRGGGKGASVAAATRVRVRVMSGDGRPGSHLTVHPWVGFPGPVPSAPLGLLGVGRKGM